MKIYPVKTKTGVARLPMLLVSTIVSSMLISPLVQAEGPGATPPAAPAGAVPPPPGPYAPAVPAPPEPPPPPQFRPSGDLQGSNAGSLPPDAGSLPPMDASEKFGNEPRYMDRTEFLKQRNAARREID